MSGSLCTTNLTELVPKLFDRSPCPDAELETDLTPFTVYIDKPYFCKTSYDHLKVPTMEME